MNARTTRLLAGRGTAKFVLPILFQWLFVHPGAAFGQLISPDATTTAATNVTPTSATLNGVVNPNGILSTTVEFEYGPTRNYGTTVTATQSPLTGLNSIEVSAEIAGLLPNSTYHYRVIATNLSRTSKGKDEKFTTDAPPTVTTNAATEVSAASATLNAVVNANGLNTTVEFEYGTTKEYGSKVTATPNLVADRSPIAVSAQITGLAPNTTYHYRVVAANPVGTSQGEDATFTTNGVAPAVATAAATDISATSATLNGIVNANGLSTTVGFEYGTTTSYGSTIPAFPSPVNGTDATAVSAVLSELSPNTIYHYRVVASNSNGTQNSADSTFTTEALAPIVATGAAAEVCSTSATLHGSVKPNGRPITVKFEYGKTTSYGDTATVTLNPASDLDSITVRADVVNLTAGETYHYRAVATNDQGKTSFGDDRAFLTYSPAFNLDATIDFPAHGSASEYKATEYRLVGLPGASDRSVSSFFAGRQNEDWEVVWDNGQPTDFLVRFNGGPEFTFSAGRAFWVINKGPWEINTAVSSAPLASCEYVPIPLHPGWNLITNPFMTPIQWSAVQSVNGGASQPIYSYSDSLNIASNFEPYVGYYFFNETNLSRLNIPYPSSSTASVASTVDPAIWRVHVALTSGGFVDKISSFGIAGEASPELDHLDFRKPRAISATPGIAFHRPAWDAQYSAFATDIRPAIGESETWNFEAFAPAGEPAQLAFSGISKIPAPFEVYLIDEGRAKTVNLREDSLYHFAPIGEMSRFSVVVGRKDAVQEKLRAVAPPREFALGHNYPNPFLSGTQSSGKGGVTTIPIAVPVASEIRIVIYNTLGREVKTIFRGALQAGSYWFNWDGKDERGSPVAAGVYLYRMTTNTNAALLGKMVVIR